MLSSPQHRRLSLSAESQRGLALKATDFFFPLASHTKEGQFVNYLLVSAQQKVLSLKLPPPFDFAQIWLQGLKKKKKKEEIERKKNRWRLHSVPWMALSGCLFKLWQSTSISVGFKKELDKNDRFAISRTEKRKEKPFLPLPSFSSTLQPAWIKIMEIRHFIRNYSWIWSRLSY